MILLFKLTQCLSLHPNVSIPFCFFFPSLFIKYPQWLLWNSVGPLQGPPRRLLHPCEFQYYVLFNYSTFFPFLCLKKTFLYSHLLSPSLPLFYFYVCFNSRLWTCLVQAYGTYGTRRIKCTRRIFSTHSFCFSLIF